MTQSKTQNTRSNPARAVANYLQYNGGPLSSLAGMLASVVADKRDAQNRTAEALEKAQAAQAGQQAQWAREDAVAQRNRDWALQDKATERENKTADALAQYAREDAVAQRNRDWALQDKATERENKTADALAQWNREDNLRQEADAKQAQQDYVKNMAPVAQKKLTPQDYQTWLQNPQEQNIQTRAWYNPLGIFGKRNVLSQNQPPQAPGAAGQFSGMSDADLLGGL